MKQIPQELIDQALMVNSKSEMASVIDRERDPSGIAIEQLFIRAHETRAIQLYMVYFTPEKELQTYCLAPMRLHNSLSKVSAYRNRLVYMQVNMNPKPTVNEDGQKIIGNTSAELFKLLMKPSSTGTDGKLYHNHYNSCIITSRMRLAVVPSEHMNVDQIVAFNNCSAVIRKVHEQLKAHSEAQGFDLASNIEYQKVMAQAYKEYLEDMNKLIRKGDVSITQVFSVVDNGLIPSDTLDSERMSANPFRNAVGLLKENISNMPTLNIYAGYASVDSSATQDDINPELTLGLRQLGKNDESTEEVVSTKAKRQEATRLAYISDAFGNKSSILLRRQDAGFVNPRNGSLGLAESFMKTTERNSGVYIVGKVLPFVSSRDVGGSANGLLRMSVVADEVIPQRMASSVSSVEGSIVDETEADDVDSTIAALLARASESSSEETGVTFGDTTPDVHHEVEDNDNFEDNSSIL